VRLACLAQNAVLDFEISVAVLTILDPAQRHRDPAVEKPHD
jgi:hypothetical protein